MRSVYNNVAVKGPMQLRSLVADTEPGTTVTVTVVRDKKTRDVKVTIGELPKTVAKARGPDEKGRGGRKARPGRPETSEDRRGCGRDPGRTRQSGGSGGAPARRHHPRDQPQTGAHRQRLRAPRRQAGATSLGAAARAPWHGVDLPFGEAGMRVNSR